MWLIFSGWPTKRAHVTMSQPQLQRRCGSFSCAATLSSISVPSIIPFTLSTSLRFSILPYTGPYTRKESSCYFDHVEDCSGSLSLFTVWRSTSQELYIGGRRRCGKALPAVFRSNNKNDTGKDNTPATSYSCLVFNNSNIQQSQQQKQQYPATTAESHTTSSTANQETTTVIRGIGFFLCQRFAKSITPSRSRDDYHALDRSRESRTTSHNNPCG